VEGDAVVDGHGRVLVADVHSTTCAVSEYVVMYVWVRACVGVVYSTTTAGN
jgi:hypothetical protein